MPDTDQPYRRKLIEVSLPLDVISEESAGEKSIGRGPGHPSTLHTWWARRPLAACRAVIFASLVDDPIDCSDEFPTEADQAAERERLHEILRNISRWENTDERKPENTTLMNRARLEVARSLARTRGDTAPVDPNEVLMYLSDEKTGVTIYDPFSGGGSIPLEAQRLGLNAIGSDLNPIAVLITKATIELPVPFKDHNPINPVASQPLRSGSTVDPSWRGYTGLASDIRHYGKRIRSKAFERIGHYYPTVTLDDGTESTVVAWLWANTVPCPNPACGIAMPLIRSFRVSQRKGHPKWTQPIKSPNSDSVNFEIVDDPSGIKVRLERKDEYPRTVGRSGVICVECETSRSLDYVRNQALAGNMRQQLIGIAADGSRRREYLAPIENHERIAFEPNPPRRPGASLPSKGLGISAQGYGFFEWHQLFTERQLTSICTFSDALNEVVAEIVSDGATKEYANLVRTYLSLAIGRLAHYNSRLCRWRADSVAGVFGRGALGMVWDFAEANPFAFKAQNWMAQVETVAKVVERLPLRGSRGLAFQADAANTHYDSNGPVIVTDPPYYDNIGYADLSDFFYVWHSDLLRDVFPDLFVGRQTPKTDEIIAGPMFDNPKERFERLMGEALGRIKASCSNDFPSSIFYGYVQKESGKKGATTTGWETFLTAVSNVGLRIVGTWPVRTEDRGRLRALSSNALASSVVLVTRPRDEDAPMATRQQFVAELESTLPMEIDRLTRQDNIAPVDLAQAAIGPGMKIYTKYSSVETIAGDPVHVREALTEINRVIGDYFLSEQGELDAPTFVCVDLLKVHGFNEGLFGDAEGLAKAKNVTIGSLVSSGLLEAKMGKVRLLPISYFRTTGRDLSHLGPETTSWEGLMRVAFHFRFPEEGDGVEGAADVIRQMGSKADQVERLARIMFDHYDRSEQPGNSRVYNYIADAWHEIREQAGYGRQMTNQ